MTIGGGTATGVADADPASVWRVKLVAPLGVDMYAAHTGRKVSGI